ncbi:unnamed protein product [Closterium sp. Yama58-4]|nr:unnamed protein product [Closterium sp. Yama58-4]
MGEGKKQRVAEGDEAVARTSGREEEVRVAMEEVQRAMEEVRECVEEWVAAILRVVPRVRDKLDGRVHDEAGWTWRETVVYELSQPGMAEVWWCGGAVMQGRCGGAVMQGRCGGAVMQGRWAYGTYCILHATPVRSVLSTLVIVSEAMEESWT